MLLLALSLAMVASMLSSCSYFIDYYLAQEGSGLYIPNATYRPRETNSTPSYTLPKPETTEDGEVETVKIGYPDTSAYRPVTTAVPVTEPPKLYTIPSEFEDHVYLGSKDRGRCAEMSGSVIVTVLVLNDKVSSWDGSARNELVKSLKAQEKFLESGAAEYGKELDISFSFRDINISSEATPRDEDDKWIEDAYKAAGFSGRSGAQAELDASNDADSNPIAIALNKSGRAFANQRTTLSGTEMIVIFSDDSESFSHELCHVYGAEDFYYPAEADDLALKYLPESIMNGGDAIDPLTAFLIGWDDVLDSAAYNFLDATKKFTSDYLKEENRRETYTGQVTDFVISQGIYTGYLENGQPVGEGKMIYRESGTIYEGNFVNGDFHGKGTAVYSDGDKYSGDWVNGNRHGMGTYTWTDGDSYTGDWVEGERTGKGTYTWNDGATYTGDFIKGERTGNGTMKFSDGYKYVGEWLNNQRHGRGTMTHSNGYKYVGEWKNDQYSGYGEAVYTGGDRYVGNFSDGDRHGTGTYTWINGGSYSGDWKNGERTGKGIYKWTNGDVYEGDFVKGERTGKGKYTWSGGNYYEGDFIDGVRTGQGTFRWTSGAYYTGAWLNNKRHGYGKYVNQYGEVFEGQWNNDVFQ